MCIIKYFASGENLPFDALVYKGTEISTNEDKLPNLAVTTLRRPTRACNIEFTTIKCDH
jgi:hypothetical protein